MWIRTRDYQLVNLDSTAVLFVHASGQVSKNGEERVYEVSTGTLNNRASSIAAGSQGYCGAVIDALTDAIENDIRIVDLRKLQIGEGYESVELRHGQWVHIGSKHRSEATDPERKQQGGEQGVK
jgi:hypothetical protein